MHWSVWSVVLHHTLYKASFVMSFPFMSISSTNDFPSFIKALNRSHTVLVLIYFGEVVYGVPFTQELHELGLCYVDLFYSKIAIRCFRQILLVTLGRKR